MIRKLVTATVALASAVLLTPTGLAQVSLPFYDSFPATYGVGTNLGAGASASIWTYGNSTGTASPFFTNIDLSYPMLLDQSDLSVRVGPNATTSNRDRGVALNLQPGVNFNGPLYFSYLLRVDALPTTFTNVISFFRNSSGTGGSITPSVGVYLQPNGRIMISKQSLGNPVASAASVTLGDTYLIVGRYTVVTGSDNDPFDLWINPSPATLGVPEGSVPAPDLSAIAGADNSWLYGFYLTTKASTTAWASQATFLVDDVRLGTTWADVTPLIPEPATTLLAVVSGFGLLWLRLRRKQ